MTKPFATMLLDIPDDVLRQLLDQPKDEQGETLSETVSMALRRGLQRLADPRTLTEAEADQAIVEAATQIIAFPIGKTFTSNDLFGSMNLAPTDRKRIGKMFAAAVKGLHYVVLDGKTAQNHSTYRRVENAKLEKSGEQA